MRVLISHPSDKVIHMDVDSQGQSTLTRHLNKYYYVSYICLTKKIKRKRVYVGKRGFERAWRWCYRNLINS